MAYDTKLMVKIANLYYKENLKQESIARRLKVSKYQVNRILKKALNSGMVQINIIDPTKNISDLEEKLEKKFKLKRAIVVENFGLSDTELKAKIGQAASRYLLDIIKEGDIIGVSWGTTINEVINYLPTKINRSVEVVQITGGSHELSIDLNCHDITRRFASKFGVNPHLLYAPSIVDTKKMHDMLLEETSIKKTFNHFSKLTIAMVGIGAMYPRVISTLVKTGHIGGNELESLKTNGAVGDVYSHFFDIHGKTCDNKLSERIIAMPVKELLRVPYSIGIAGGELKAEAILGAIRGKYINILITDSNAGEKIMEIS
ncbi:MAG: sugar-binding transcriptional regulator [Actinobacteria bacterium]|nr:sugar-binding transcriptional regulator [Actinomycetota bacterium]